MKPASKMQPDAAPMIVWKKQGYYWFSKIGVVTQWGPRDFGYMLTGQKGDIWGFRSLRAVMNAALKRWEEIEKEKKR